MRTRAGGHELRENSNKYLFSPFRSLGALMTLIGFTLSNARRFYSSMGNPLYMIQRVNLESSRGKGSAARKMLLWRRH